LRSILKALGLTLWSASAILLSVILIAVAYRVAMKYRASRVLSLESELNDQDAHSQPGSSAGSIALPSRTGDSGPPAAVVRPVAETRKLLMSAFISRQYAGAIGYGKDLVERQSSEPGDLSIVAQAFYEISDCPNALAWRRRARESFQRAGLEPDFSLQAITSCCTPVPGKPQTSLDSPQRARLDRILNRADAAKTESGYSFVRLGELYFGFGEYELAVAAIDRALEKGNIPHLEEAYVYLGRSEAAMGNTQAARDAFAKLKDVPGISPRVVRLWTLYAETRLAGETALSANSDAAVSNDAECRTAGS
jgi:tetratricopeptide (TPR) repeat protein